MNTSILRIRNTIQTKAVNAILAGLKTERRALNVMATGVGKTHVALKVIARLLKVEKKARILWITHTNELIEQAAFRASTELKGVDIGRYDSGERDTESQIIIASVATLSRKQHLRKFKRNAFDYVFVDEVHHIGAESWQRTVKHFKTARKLGFTATPYRPDESKDEQSTIEFFGEPVYELKFSKAQKLGILARDESYIILTDSVLAPIVTKDGEYSPRALDRLHSSTQRNQIIINAYRKYGRAKMVQMGIKPKAICYCVNRKHAIRMSKLFRSNGIPAAFILGSQEDQSKRQREKVWSEFKTGTSIEVLCAVNVLNEGVDVPDVGCLIMARPTRSNIIYAQQVGRGARAFVKKKFVVLDFVDNIRREFQCYTMGNFTGRKTVRESVVTEFLKEQDTVKVEIKAESCIEGLEKFELGFKSIDPEKKKSELIQLAISGASRPKHSTPLGSALLTYIRPYGRCIDSKFAAKINKIRPDWMIFRAKKSNAELLALAKRYNSITEFKKNNPGAYQSILHRKLRLVAFKHLNSSRDKSNSQVLSAALKYKQLKDLPRKLYAQIRSRGLLSKLQKKIRPLTPTDYVKSKPIINLSTGELYNSQRIAARRLGLASAKNFTRSIKNKYRVKGFNLEYYDHKKHAHLVKKKAS